MTSNSLDLNKDEDFVAWNWLTSKGKVNLKDIDNFEKAFSNGYKLGVALFNAGLLNSQDQLKDSAERVDTLKNFTIIFNCLNTKDIPFDASFAKNIINKQPGIIVKLVNQIVQKDSNTISLNRLNRETKKNTAKVNVNPEISKKVNKEQNVSYQNVLQRKFSEIRELNEDEAKQMREMDDHTRN